jgi:predicted DCC family thiol-disulfide oxidoreductase YuxK
MDRVIVYDGECSFCSGVVKFIRRHDRRGIFTYIPLQNEEAKSILRVAGLPVSENGTVVYKRADKHYLRSSAALHILKDLGGLWRILFIFIVVPPFIRDGVYRFIARNRHRLAGLLS